MTKTAWNTFAKKGKITCTSNGEKIDGKVIWYDESGLAYDLSFARLTKTYAFVRMPKFDR